MTGSYKSPIRTPSQKSKKKQIAATQARKKKGQGK